MAGITSLDVAVLNKFNQLAERHGLNPTDFIAVLRYGDVEGVVLQIEASPQGKDGVKAEKMLAAIGVKAPHKQGASSLAMGDGRDVYKVLDAAVQKAPRPRTV